VASFYLQDIVGAGDVANGKAKAAKGLKAIGTDTVQITLDRPVAYFLYSFTYPTSDVMEQNVAPGANLTTKPELIVGAGPFMIKDGTWKYRQEITLVPNPSYYDAKHIQLKEIDIPFIGTVETAFKAYQSGQYPIAAVPAAYVASYRSKPEFHESPILGDLWYAMNPKMAPFTDIHFRRAIANGINRDAIVRGTEHNTQIKLDGWYPNGILGYDASIGSQVPHYDAAIAKQELALAKKDLGTIPAVQLEYPSDSEDWGRDAAQAQSDLRAVGITMNLKPTPGNTWLQDVSDRKTPFILNNWFDDYPDPQDFSEVLIGTGGQSNAGNYSNPKVDALFARADTERDVATREKLYKQAQNIIMNDAAVVMLYQFATQTVWSTKIHGLESNPSGIYPLANNWANMTVSP
jgi:ABC-type oligopeptide transport system substrate-binding subunit